MLKNKNLSIKVLILLIMISIFAITVNLFIGYTRMSNMKQEVFKTTTQDLKTELSDALTAKKKVWLTNALQIANNPTIQKAMYENNRQTCINILNNYSKTFKENTSFNNIKVHLINENLTSFVKTWDTDNYGERISYSDAYKKVKRSKEPMVTIETSPKGLRLKGLYPVHYKNQFIGIVNFEGGLNSIKRKFTSNNIEFLYFLKNNHLNIASSLKNKSQIEGYTLSQKDINKTFLNHVTSKLDLHKALENYQSTDQYLISAVKAKSFNDKEIGIYVIAQEKQYVLSQINKTQNMMYLIYASFVLIFILQIVIIYFYINKYISKPINILKNKFKKIAEGELNQKIDDEIVERGDELGSMGKAISSMLNSFRNIVGQIADISESLSSSSEELSASSEEIYASTEQVSTAVQEVASGAEEQSAQIEDTKDSIDDLSDQLDNINEMSNNMDDQAENVIKNLGKGNKAVDNSIDQIKDVKDKSEAVSNKVNELGSLSEEISKIIELIGGISEQTNLLALNAAIEAARAGEAGRGFSVVADEIRELAEESTKATEEIGALINKIQDRVESTIIQVSEAGDAVDNSVEAIETAENSFDEINEAVSNLKKSIENISISVREMNNSSDDVEDAMNQISIVSEEASSNAEEVAASSEEQSASTQEIADASENLAQMAQDLKETVNEFNI